MERHSTNKITGVSTVIDTLSAFGSRPCLLLSEPVASILCCEEQLFLCIGNVTEIVLGNTPAEEIAIDTLSEEGVKVTFQLIHVIPTSEEDDPERKHG